MKYTIIKTDMFTHKIPTKILRVMTERDREKLKNKKAASLKLQATSVKPQASSTKLQAFPTPGGGGEKAICDILSQ